MQLKHANLYSGIFMLLVAGILWLQTTGHGFDNTDPANNPMWFPRILLSLLGGLSALLIAKSLISNNEDTMHALRHKRFACVFISIFIYMWGFSTLGFLIISFVFVIMFSLLLGYRRLPILIPYSLILTSSIWYLFANVFFIRPPGFGLDDLFRYF